MAKENPIYESLAPLGFETAGSACFGIWSGYAVSLRQSQSNYLIELAARTDRKDKQLRKNVHKAVKQRCSKRYHGCYENGKAMVFTVSFDRKTPFDEQGTAFLDVFVSVLRENGVAPAETCSVCGGAHPDSLCWLDGYQPVHAACVRSLSEQTREKAEHNQENGSYLTGILGGIVGMLAGLVPSLLTILWMERIYGVLFALVPLAAMWGYRKCRGKQNTAAIVIVIVLSLLGVFVLEAVVVAIGVTREYGMAFGTAFSLTMSYLVTGEGFVAMLGDCIMEFVFMAVGILLAWGYLRQTNTTAIAAMDAVAGTLRPIGDAAPVESGAATEQT